MTRIHDASVYALHVYCKGIQFVYADLASTTSEAKTIARLAGISLLAKRVYYPMAQEHGELDLNAHSTAAYITVTNAQLRKYTDARELRNLASQGYGPWAKSKVTGAHHTWYTPDDVLSVAPRERDIDMIVALERLKNFKETEAFVAGFLLWVATADLSLVRPVLRRADMWAKSDIKSWIGNAKALTEPLKTHHHLTATPLEQAFELQVIANRGIGQVDWAAEKENRVKPVLVRVQPGEIYKCARRFFEQGAAQGYAYPTETWAKYWSRRWAAAPGGSVHSQHRDDDDYISHERTERTKFFTLMSMPDRGLEYWLKRQPEIAAWPSSKYEWAKNRAIYGTDLTSYLLTDFSMPAAEEALSHVFPVGRKANEEYVQERVRLAGEGGIALCFDYEDFNSQHTLGSQVEVIEAYADAFATHMSPDQAAAIRWAAKSALNQRVVGGDTYSTRGGLLSGWRLTTVVNTVLNRAYLELAGCLTHVIDSVHNGDDVLAYTRTVSDAVTVMRKAHDYGIRAQPAKCAIGGLEEFLRVDRAADKPTGAQYLTRAIATAVHARAESNEPDSPLSLLRSQLTRVGELEARGAAAPVIEKLTDIGVQHVARVFDMERSALDEARSTHLVHGGLALDPDLEPKILITPEMVPADISDIDQLKRKPGVVDYANYLKGIFDLSPREVRVATASIARATHSSVRLVRRALVRSPIGDVTRARTAQYLYGVCSDEYAVQAHTGRARLAGLPVGRMALSNLTGGAIVRIASSHDPIATMRIIF
jgi:hypothetical protein